MNTNFPKASFCRATVRIYLSPINPSTSYANLLFFKSSLKRPERVVSEMLRVARKAVVLSDENRFAYGSFPGRVPQS